MSLDMDEALVGRRRYRNRRGSFLRSLKCEQHRDDVGNMLGISHVAGNRRVNVVDAVLTARSDYGHVVCILEKADQQTVEDFE